MAITPIDLESAYVQCEVLARTHYENFPVASYLLPKKIRRPIAVVYAFARQADDVADEGEISPLERLRQLQHFWLSLENIKPGFISTKPTEPLFIALQDTFTQHPTLQIDLFFDLLRAFKQDVIKETYENFAEIYDYCHYSANPIGRLLLQLTNQATEENLKNSDAICTALQLINFLQDLKSDLIDRNRCYLPKDEMLKLNITLEQLLTCQKTEAIHTLINDQLTHALQLLNDGRGLGKRLKGMFGFEIRLVIHCAYHMISALQSRQDVYARPTLRWWHWPKILWLSLR